MPGKVRGDEVVFDLVSVGQPGAEAGRDPPEDFRSDTVFHQVIFFAKPIVIRRIGQGEGQGADALADVNLGQAGGQVEFAVAVVIEIVMAVAAAQGPGFGLEKIVAARKIPHHGIVAFARGPLPAQVFEQDVAVAHVAQTQVKGVGFQGLLLPPIDGYQVFFCIVAQVVGGGVVTHVNELFPGFVQAVEFEIANSTVIVSVFPYRGAMLGRQEQLFDGRIVSLHLEMTNAEVIAGQHV